MGEGPTAYCCIPNKSPTAAEISWYHQYLRAASLSRGDQSMANPKLARPHIAMVPL